jgi:hypothetical protein
MDKILSFRGSPESDLADDREPSLPRHRTLSNAAGAISSSSIDIVQRLQPPRHINGISDSATVAGIVESAGRLNLR